jgi:hypothetical protein
MIEKRASHALPRTGRRGVGQHVAAAEAHEAERQCEQQESRYYSIYVT